MDAIKKKLGRDIDENDEVVLLNEESIGKILTWPMAFWSADQSFRAVAKPKSDLQPEAYKMNRLVCQLPDKGFFASMPGYVTNFPVPKDLKFVGINHEKEIETEELETFGCKIITGFPSNAELSPVPLPMIMGTICLFDTETGQVRAILEATTLTAWRTAAASTIATQYLYFNRHSNESTEDHDEKRHLAVIGTGIQGSMHAIAMLTKFRFASITMWDREDGKTEEIRNELNEIRYLFVNVNVDIKAAETVKECVENADVIVTATKSNTALIHADMIKKGAHINAIGVDDDGHASELGKEVYEKCKLYVDDIIVANNELGKDICEKICGMVGDVIVGNLPEPSVDEITLFQSRGMAAEDVTLAKIVYEIYHRGHKKGKGCCSIM